MVGIFTSEDPIKMNAVTAVLEAAGIPFYLSKNPKSNTMLMVPEEQTDKAVSLIRNYLDSFDSDDKDFQPSMTVQERLLACFILFVVVATVCWMIFFQK